MTRTSTLAMLLLTACEPGSKGQDGAAETATEAVDSTTPTDTGPAAGEDLDGDGWSPSDGDCDDIDAAAYPGAPEICDDIDDDCDSLVDEADPDLRPEGYTDDTWYQPVPAVGREPGRGGRPCTFSLEPGRLLLNQPPVEAAIACQAEPPRLGGEVSAISPGSVARAEAAGGQRQALAESERHPGLRFALLPPA